ncbi:dynamin family protein [Catellatospora sp. NPDC049133]|uniref:dynamin family protein n=1 Tax=Catellatospora sp. NPDC049133 TaxID=3155499 RepID=UPI0034119630
MNAAREHLTFARGLCDLFSANDPRKAALAAKISQIEYRLDDPGYRLAVIGEFSSGKTTFINALIESDLFPTSALPTTAAAVEIRYGPRLAVTARFRDGQVHRLRSRRWWHLFRRRPQLPGLGRVDADLRRTLGQLITDETAAPLIAHLEVEYPAPFLSDGLIIVDTPGTNAAQGHSAVAHEAVSGADVAVIVLSGLEVLPLSLVNFLLQTLDPRLLQRCAYVVTRMDDVRPAERDELLRFATNRVRDELGVERPPVLATAPQAVIRRLRRESPRNDEQDWLDGFQQTRDWLQRTAKQQREIATTDTVLRHIDDTMRELSVELEATSAQLATERARLEASQLSDLPSFLAGHRQAGTAVLRDTRTSLANRIEYTVATARAATVQAVAAEIDACANKQTLEAVLASTVPTLVGQEMHRLGTESARLVETELEQALSAAVTSVAAAFAAEYAKLERRSGGPAGAAVAQPVVDTAALVDTSSFTAATAVFSQNTMRGAAGAAGGAAAGAALGSVVPGIGTLVGGLVGGLIGMFAATKAFATMRDQTREQAKSATEAAFGQLSARLGAGVDAALTAHEHEFTRRLDWYRVTYQRRIDEVRAEHQHDLAQLTAYTQRVNAARRDAADRRVRVDHERNALAEEWMRGERSV